MDEYLKLIKDFCLEVGIDSWEQVARTGHIEIDNRVIGLIHDGEPGGGMSIYVDLGALFTERDPGIYQKMLVANLAPHRELTGCFGVHPSTGNAVYRMRISPLITGPDLARRLSLETEEVATQFQEMVA